MLRDMWRTVFYLYDLRLIFRCDQCGALAPFARRDSRSIQAFRWTCSPACYARLVDQAIGSASPDIEYCDGTDWDDTIELMLSTRAPTLRVQMHRAMEKFECEFRQG